MNVVVRNVARHAQADRRDMKASGIPGTLSLITLCISSNVAAATFAVNSTMFGLPIASSTAARTVSNGFREVMLHRCTFT